MRPVVQSAVRGWARLPLPVGAALMVLGYHRVRERDDGMTVLPATFCMQLGWLATHRSQLPIVDLDEIVRRDANNWPQRAVAVTIDDAWEDVYLNGLQTICDTAIPATLYVPSRLLNRGEYMTHKQVRECAAAGVRIGGHSRTHADLRRCNNAELDSELRGCREDLEDLIGQSVLSFAYPFGYYDDRVRDAVAAAGYTSAVSTRRGWARPRGDIHRIPRNIVENFDLTTFRATLKGGLNLLRPIDAVRRRRG